MRAIPIKPQYGPTLGRLLSPRWRAASRVQQVLASAAAVLVIALVAGAALTLQDSVLSHGGPVPFSFRYRGLYKVAPDPGGYAKVARPRSGPPTDSFAVQPLHVPPYSGSPTGELPLVAAQRIRALQRGARGFDLLGEGRFGTNVYTYSISYTAQSDGRPMDIREVLWLPATQGARDGVDLVLATRLDPKINAATPVGTGGALQLPLRSFSFAG